jgi:hypothetical protein
VVWTDVAPDPDRHVWPAPLPAMIMRLSLNRMCETWFTTCPVETDYRAALRGYLTKIRAGLEEDSGGLTADQVDNLERYGWQRWKHHVSGNNSPT